MRKWLTARRSAEMRDHHPGSQRVCYGKAGKAVVNKARIEDCGQTRFDEVIVAD